MCKLFPHAHVRALYCVTLILRRAEYRVYKSEEIQLTVWQEINSMKVQ